MPAADLEMFVILFNGLGVQCFIIFAFSLDRNVSSNSSSRSRATGFFLNKESWSEIGYIWLARLKTKTMASEDHIKVVVRARPLIQREVEKHARMYWKIDGNSILQQDPGTLKTSTSFQFGKSQKPWHYLQKQECALIFMIWIFFQIIYLEWRPIHSRSSRALPCRSSASSCKGSTQPSLPTGKRRAVCDLLPFWNLNCCFPPIKTRLI